MKADDRLRLLDEQENCAVQSLWSLSSEARIKARRRFDEITRLLVDNRSTGLANGAITQTKGRTK